MTADDAVLGVDGCPGGWVGALVRGSQVDWYVGSLASLVELPAAVVAVDMPLALPAGGERRACEVAARARLGPARSSIFYAPPLAVLDARDHAEASVLSRAAGSVGVSIQTWHIVPKIREALALDDPRLLEVHPELSFRALGPITASKKTAAGRAERLALLGSPVLPRGVAPTEDLLDALACAWTAARWLRGEAEVLGEELLGARVSRIAV
jgi:predicted RNase H-like nuclease